MVVCGDITIKLYDNRWFKTKKLARIAFNTAFLQVNDNSFNFKIDEIDPDSLQNDEKINKDFEITVNHSSIYI